MAIHGTVAVTGFEGRLGSMLMNSNMGFIPFDCDITNYDAVVEKIKEIDPSIIINCAAFTDVDGAEVFSDVAFEINQNGVMKLRQAFKGWLIHMSTDYIFGGVQGPYSELYREDKDPSISEYGRSKLEGEKYILHYPGRPGTVVRTTMLYGNPKFPDFVKSIVQQLELGAPFEVPYNLVGSPTYIPHLIEGLIALMNWHEYDAPPILNIVGSDVVSRYEFAFMIASVWGYDKKLIVPSKEAPGKARRPKKAGLRVGKAKKMNIPIYSAISGLEAYRNDLSK